MWPWISCRGCGRTFSGFTGSDSTAEQLNSYEMEEREKRKSCVIIHEVVESESEDPVVRRDDDLMLIASMFHERWTVTMLKSKKPSDLGKRLNQVTDEGEKRRPRPLKLVLDSEQNRRKVLIRAKNLRLKEEGDWVNIVIHQDLTPVERAERKLVLEEMNKRRAGEEKNLVMFNGKIITRIPK